MPRTAGFQVEASHRCSNFWQGYQLKLLILSCIWRSLFSFSMVTHCLLGLGQLENSDHSNFPVLQWNSLYICIYNCSYLSKRYNIKHLIKKKNNK